ncbi:MAG: hypothetical protein HOW73_15695 [Polyangiaceae bacterium]|nr:hypothetical protein [Polyangiaceae bacterium]
MHPARAQVIGAVAFDPAALDTLRPLATVGADRRGSFAIQPAHPRQELVMQGDLIATVTIGSLRWLNVPEGRHVTLGHLPDTDALRKARAFGPEDILRYGDLSTTKKPCLGGEGTLELEWDGLVPGSWSDTSLEYVRFQGEFRFSGCTGIVKRSGRVRAKAVIPSFLYAFRSCREACDGSGDKGEDRVELLAPPSHWMASSVPVPEQTHPQVGTHTLVSVPLVRGGSGTATVTLNGSDIAFYLGLRGISPSWFKPGDTLANAELQLNVDVTWSEEDDKPTGMVYVAGTSADARELAAEIAPHLSGLAR